MVRPGMVKVRALAPLNEEGVNREKGEEFELPSDRVIAVPDFLIEDLGHMKGDASSADEESEASNESEGGNDE